jgi:protoporphyrinogen oxidase
MERTVDGSKSGPDPVTEDRVMLLRSRKSRIYFLRRFFDYPLTLTPDTVMKLGLWRTLKSGLSYVRSSLLPIRPETNLEQFFINRFGRELYRTFFQSYTEKVWGVPCNQISADWGAQRIKGLSVRTAIAHALKQTFRRNAGDDLSQRATETSLVERFFYPKHGPGQLWEEVARRIVEMGGEIRTGQQLTGLDTDGFRVKSIQILNGATGERETLPGDYLFSTAPIPELLRSFTAPPPQNVLEVADGLVYRNFITVGLLVKSLRIGAVADNWIYIQEPDVKLGRLQIFNNWSPFMVADPGHIWLGLEYFCSESDPLWSLSDTDMIALAKQELSKIKIIDPANVLDATVLRMEKAYPAYFGTFERFAEIREFVDRYQNLFLIGRNGMHRYNNQDHSMLTAMMAVENIVAGKNEKDNLWEINTETEYSEEDLSKRRAI